jgi:hypothetical protein
MCKGEGCQVRDNCYRHTAEPEPLQVYAQYWLDPSFTPERGCNRWIPLTGWKPTKPPWEAA